MYPAACLGSAAVLEVSVVKVPSAAVAVDFGSSVGDQNLAVAGLEVDSAVEIADPWVVGQSARRMMGWHQWVAVAWAAAGSAVAVPAVVLAAVEVFEEVVQPGFDEAVLLVWVVPFRAVKVLTKEIDRVKTP